MLSIKDWLNADVKDYGIGLAILGTNSKNRMLLQNLSRKQNPAKLEYELRKIAVQKGIDLNAEDPGDTKDLENLDDSGGNQQESGQKDLGANPEVGENAATSDNNPPQVDQATDQDNAELDKTAESVVSGKLTIVRGEREVKFEDLPEEMQARWNQNRDASKEIRATHEKLKLMENASDEDRQPLTARIAELDDLIRANWEAIDAWKPVPAKTKEDETGIDHKRINANRKYISTNLKKLAEDMDEVKAAKIRDQIKLRLKELKNAGESVSDATIEELKKQGFEC